MPIMTLVVCQVFPAAACHPPPHDRRALEWYARWARRAHTVSKIGSTREHLIETYSKRARHYDITSQLYYPQRAHRRRAVQGLRLRPGDTVVEIACGTGLNFPL